LPLIFCYRIPGLVAVQPYLFSVQDLLNLAMNEALSF
jgi:hypothetical protein